MSYADSISEHDRRVRGIFALYNARRFDELLTHYADDVVCFLPTVINPDMKDMQWSYGKAEYKRHLEFFYEAFGKMTVLAVFASPDSTSVMVIDEHENTGSFSIEVAPESRQVQRVFFHHQPKKANAAWAPPSKSASPIVPDGVKMYMPFPV